MDDPNDRSRRPSTSGRRPDDASRSGPLSSTSRPNGGNGQNSGGLLSRYGGQPSRPIDGAARDDRPAAGAGGKGLLSRAREQQEGLRGALQGLTQQARRLGENVRRAATRTPQSGDWRATDFDPTTLEAWDRQDEAPFRLPEEPEFTGDHRRAASARSEPGRQPDRRPDRRDYRQDDEWDAGWETGTWDTGWATGYEPAAEYGRPGREHAYGGGGVWSPGQRDWYDEDDDALSRSLNTLARLAAVGAPIGRIARLRLLIRTRPAAAALLALFLLGFMLTCCAPLIPLLRLGYDATDALTRVNTLQGMFADTSSLLSAPKLKDAQGEVDALTHDLYEINSAMNVAGAPFAAVSTTIRNYRLLTRIGFDLTASADEGLQVAQTLLTPLQGGALAANTGTPGLTLDDIAQARAVLADASIRIQDALAAASQFNPAVLKGPLKKLTKYLALLPTAPAVLSEISRLLDSAPALLGIGQPANYLLLVMDRSELRPSGGFIGNYGILTLEGGKQSTTYPLALDDTYNLDSDYYQHFLQLAGPGADCVTAGPQPPNYYWWWPVRQDSACTIAWGLRDSGLSADFPTNARTAEQIVSDTPNKVPNTGKLQGVIAFTPILIEELLQVTGPIAVPEWGVTVTPQNLEREIHEFQLGIHKPKNAPRKTFTHDLATELLNRIKSEHGSGLKAVLKIAETAVKDKDLQLYFNDPQAELILRQLGLSSEISTGNGDGFFVVDTNDGGNKANLWVTEKQTDYVTLLPDGGALHRLQISVTYAKKGPVYEGTEQQMDYIDMQRTYLPGDATILGYSGFVPPGTFGFGGGCFAATAIADCGPTHVFSSPTTASDVPGRNMVFGSLWLSCGAAIDPTHTIETQEDFTHLPGTPVLKYDFNNGCYYTPIARTQNIYIEWYTPHAFTIDAGGHGTYTELVEKQPGSGDFLLGVGDYLTVYVDTSQLHARQPNLGNTNIVTVDDWNALIGGKKPFINNQQIESNTTVSFGF